MEQVLATINYFIREKLWCSIRRLADIVCYLFVILVGNEKRSRSYFGVLESFWYLSRG